MKKGKMSDISRLLFSSDFVDSLPCETSKKPGARAVHRACSSLVDPTPVKDPRLVAWSRELAERFGLSRPAERGPAVDLLTGNLVTPGMKPFAACYGGHQFGHWAGQLGDGRAIGLGDLPDADGRPWEFQLKGAGLTPYSRGADGRAVLRSSLREFVASEAMHALGVPTTRALSLTVTGEDVVRDMFYDGHPKLEPGAVVCRVAPTFVRFGSFEILAARDEIDVLRAIADHVMSRHFPEIRAGDYVAWFREISRRTASLMAEWLRVGFVHGVMNTDNMSIVGLTIDYGPYGWLDPYDPNWTPNTTDLPGRRYCYGRQPAVGQWNLAQLARALSPLVPENLDGLRAGLDLYETEYGDAFRRAFAAKLGLAALEGDDDVKLLMEMDDLLQAHETDMTIFFRGLADLPAESRELPEFLRNSFYGDPSADVAARWSGWLTKYRARAGRDGLDPRARRESMNRANPLYVPRNYLLQEAIDRAEDGDPGGVEELLEVLRRPYEEQPGKGRFEGKRPDWAKDRAGCSTLSCSS